MLVTALEGLATEFFRGLNQLVDPLVRAGVGAPEVVPLGTIVIETVGRNTGRRSSVPLMAAEVGEYVVVSTIRKRSNWLKNVAANPEVRFWLRGREVEAQAFAIRSGGESSAQLPPSVRCLATALGQHSAMFGTGFAILIPRN